ncbi:MAG TPA: DUF4105 domain-containing protein, partial [Gammaproteobacteria bacterium]|nr:DUF4105 domain-containing protein [Gammaproteobacteria bacterium]
MSRITAPSSTSNLSSLSEETKWTEQQQQPPIVVVFTDETRLRVQNIIRYHFELGVWQPTLERYTQSFDTKTLTDVSLISADRPAFSHTILKFTFESGSVLIISFHGRCRRGEHYDGMRGLFQYYELLMLCFDESFLRFRQRIEREILYSFPLQITKDQQQDLLLYFLQHKY